MLNKQLADRCKTNTNIETNTFVGIKAVDGDITVNFPLGYHLSENEKDLRKDILLLLNVLMKHTDMKNSEINTESAFNDVTLPIQAYIFVIADYYSRGYYKEREIIYSKAKRGKINWGKTVKTQRAYLQDDEIYYLDFITKKQNINDNEIITLIHKYCVYESFLKVGWLFSAYLPDKPQIKFNKRLFLNTIKRKLNETFNDANRQLFKNMIAIISSLGNDGTANNYRYGTNRFEYVWESMIDKVYGIRNKDRFFPKTKWIIGDNAFDNASLEPDTIMIHNGSIYIIDAKYYKYGWSKAPKHLPESTSINKQITYGEYVAESATFRKKLSLDTNPTVYNAFLMPYDSFGTAFHTEKELHYIGSAISDWKSSDGTKPYEKVQGILLDVKSLMLQNSCNKDKIFELAELIDKNL